MHHACRYNKPVEQYNPMPSPNFEFPVFEAEEEEEEIPKEIARLLEQERKGIQPHEEILKVVNLGTEENKKEVKIGAWLDDTIKGKLIELLREYVDVFAWSYRDMAGLGTAFWGPHYPPNPNVFRV